MTLMQSKLILSLGIAFQDVKGQLFPIVGLAGAGVVVQGRFSVEVPSEIREQLPRLIEQFKLQESYEMIKPNEVMIPIR
jgi:hypothetical protein